MPLDPPRNPPAFAVGRFKTRIIILTALILLALLGTLPFWFSDLDLRLAALFYHPGADDPWFESREPLWLFLYQIAPLLIGLLTLGSLAVIAAGSVWPAAQRRRRAAIFLLAVVLIGPGLMVNILLKDHMGRPRPHQTVELGGTQVYLPPLALGEAGKGKSFPCGHSSAGFVFGAFFLIWRHRRPRLAVLSLVASVALGLLLGISRMAAGDHFVSDVIWSAVIVGGVALLLAPMILRDDVAAPLTASSPRPARRHPVALMLTYGLTAVLLVFGMLLATPMSENSTQLILSSSHPPRTLRLIADDAQITLIWHDQPEPAAKIFLKARGFGLPGNRVLDHQAVEDGALTYRIVHQGLFSEKDTTLLVIASPSAWDRIDVETAAGDIRVDPLPSAAPTLVLKTGNGQIRRDMPALTAH